MKLEVNLPTVIYCDDSNDLAVVETYFTELINKNIKVKELHTPHLGHFTGLIYIGRLTDPENKAFIKKIKEEALNEIS